jgi:hypothetical protein
MASFVFGVSDAPEDGRSDAPGAEGVSNAPRDYARPVDGRPHTLGANGFLVLRRDELGLGDAIDLAADQVDQLQRGFMTITSKRLQYGFGRASPPPYLRHARPL